MSSLLNSSTNKMTNIQFLISELVLVFHFQCTLMLHILALSCSYSYQKKYHLLKVCVFMKWYYMTTE